MSLNAAETRFHVIFGETINDAVEPRDDLTASDVDGWTSLTHINLIYAIEDEFRIEFTQDEMSGLRTLGELKEIALSKARLGSS